jgi:hypothetical protein
MLGHVPERKQRRGPSSTGMLAAGAQRTSQACGASCLTIAWAVTPVLLPPHISSHEPRKILRTSSSEGTATKHPESGTHVSPLNAPSAMFSVDVQRGLLSAGQLPLSAAATYSSRDVTRSSAIVAGLPAGPVLFPRDVGRI